MDESIDSVVIHNENFGQPTVNPNEGILSDDSDGLLSDDDGSSEEDEFGFGRVRGMAMDLKGVIDIEEDELQEDKQEEDSNNQFNIAFYNEGSDDMNNEDLEAKVFLSEEEITDEEDNKLHERIAEETYNKTILSNLQILSDLDQSG